MKTMKDFSKITFEKFIKNAENDLWKTSTKRRKGTHSAQKSTL